MKPILKLLKNNLILIYRILLGIVLVGKISNWFLDFNDQTNQVLNTAMLCLIGIAYLTVFWAFDKFILKAIFFVCGIYLILMNFISESEWSSIIGIICIITPMIIGKFLPEDDQEAQLE